MNEQPNTPRTDAAIKTAGETFANECRKMEAELATANKRVALLELELSKANRSVQTRVEINRKLSERVEELEALLLWAKASLKDQQEKTTAAFEKLSSRPSFRDGVQAAIDTWLKFGDFDGHSFNEALTRLRDSQPSDKSIQSPETSTLTIDKATAALIADCDKYRAQVALLADERDWLNKRYDQQINQIAALQSSAQSPPRINIRCEVKSGLLQGSQNLNVVRVEQEDDDSWTVVTDHWPANAAAQSPWIPVSERMPTREDANETDEVLWADKNRRETMTWNPDMTHPFTHWMPIPPIPAAPQDDGFETFARSKGWELRKLPAGNYCSGTQQAYEAWTAAKKS